MSQFTTKKCMFFSSSFFSRFLKRAVLDQLSVDGREVSRGRYVDVECGCLHFNGTSTALQQQKRNVLLLPSASVKRFSVSSMRDYSSYSTFVIQKSMWRVQLSKAGSATQTQRKSLLYITIEGGLLKL